MKKINLLIATLFFLVACKEEKKKATESPVSHNFVVTMKMIVPENDGFQIYWDESGNGSMKPENNINVNVKGNPDPQDIVFKLPEDVLPSQLRFDIGSNKNQKTMQVVSFKIEYLNKKFEVLKKEDFWLYWGNNTSIKYTKETATIQPITNLPEGYDPIFGGTPGLKTELQNLVK